MEYGGILNTELWNDTEMEENGICRNKKYGGIRFTI